VPKFGRKVPHLRCDSHTSFKVKRVTGPINADTHCASYLANAKAYKLTTYRWHPQVNTNLVYVRRSYSRSTVLSIMILMYLTGVQGTLLSQTSVELNITVTVR